MSKCFKVLSIVFLMIFSFYYTEKVAMYVQNNTPLKKEIVSYKETNQIKYVNAEIDGDYIVPGINGLEVNVDKSYSKMKTYNVFSENNIVYNQVKPQVSILNFKDKVIHRGNQLRNAVSIIIDNDNKFTSFFEKENITYDYINNTKYCIKLNNDDCKNTKKQIVEPTLILYNHNFLKDLSKVSKGYIIYIGNDLNINYINALVNHIRYNNIKVIKLNVHLSEYFKP